MDADLQCLGRTSNLRDIGGLRSGDGRRVRRGDVYRSGMLDAGDAASVARLVGLGIRTIVDLRANGERATWPTPWKEVGCVDYWCLDHEDSAGNLQTIIEDKPDDAAGLIREEMLRIYRVLPFAQRHAYRALFHALAENRVPLLFHCAAGKDRTGVAAALILSTLDVPADAIMRDYLQTNTFDLRGSRQLRGQAFPAGMAAAAFESLLAADPAYLDAMFADLNRRHGSTRAYLASVLGIGAADLARIRANLLEPA